MIITLFETNNFKNWCLKDINKYKKSILTYSFNYMSCFLDNTKDKQQIALYEKIKDVLLENNSSLKFILKESEDGEILESCILYQSISVKYDIYTLLTDCEKYNIPLTTIKEFVKNLAYFAIDAAITVFKEICNINFPTIPIYNSYLGKLIQYPISYNLDEFICFIKSNTAYNIKYRNISEVVVKNKTIFCPFIGNRLKTEWKVQKSLFKIYLKEKGFFDTKNHLNKLSESNTLYTLESFEIATQELLQQVLLNKFVKEKYPVFQEKEMYDLLDNEIDNTLDFILEFMCSFFEHHNLCQCNESSGLPNSKKCMIYKKDGLLETWSSKTLDELINPETLNQFVSEYIQLIKNTIEAT